MADFALLTEAWEGLVAAAGTTSLPSSAGQPGRAR